MQKFLRIDLTRDRSKDRKLADICRAINNDDESVGHHWLPMPSDKDSADMGLVKHLAIYEEKTHIKLSEIAEVRQGLATGNKARFTRLVTEVEGLESKIGTEWFIYGKGAGYSPYFRRVALLVDWRDHGKEIRTYKKGNKVASRVQNEKYYGLEGLSYSRVRSPYFSAVLVDNLCIIGANGPGIFIKDSSRSSLSGYLALMNSPVFSEYVKSYALANWEVGIVKVISLPREVQELTKDEDLCQWSKECEDILRRLHSGPLSYPSRVSEVYSYLVGED